jgi:outer membrane protein assembly factor BamA
MLHFGGWSLSLRLSQISRRRLIGSLLPLSGALCLLRLPTAYSDPLSPTTTGPATSQTAPQSTAASTPSAPVNSVVAPDLLNRPVEEIRVTGNAQVSLQVILNQVRTQVGDKFVPEQVQEDYQRIYGLKRFSNVQAKVEPTASGVIVIFEVTEEKLIRAIRFQGNTTITSDVLSKDIDLKVGEAIEQFRIALAKRAIIADLRNKNHPFAHVDVDTDNLTKTGELVFKIVEGPNVKIRNIAFIGNKSFSADQLGFFWGKLNEQVRSRWETVWGLLDSGALDLETVEEDVAALRHFYQSQGYFDVKVGRKLIYSPDQTEVEIDYLIDEGPRYKVARILFQGNTKLSDQQLRKDFQLTEGKYFDSEAVQHDVKQIIRAYSPLGYVYDPNSTDQAYLQVGKAQYPWTAKLVYHKEPGTLDLVYEISEGRPFRLGNIHLKGNDNTQDKVVDRELRVQPGQLYNSGELTDAVDRIKALPEFTDVKITPIGNAPDTRDVLVDLSENAHTAQISFGGQVDSNLGLGGNFKFTQTNFDISKFPNRVEDLWTGDKAFVGAGQTFSATFQPGINYTNARVAFTEPYVFDQPYSNTDEAYYEQYQREAWYERHAGGAITFGKQINYEWTTAVTLGAEDVYIGGITDYHPLTDRVDVISPITHLPVNNRLGQVQTYLRSERAPEVLAAAGDNAITNIGWTIRHDATNPGTLSYKGDRETFRYDYYGAMGGSSFSKFTLSLDNYTTLYTDVTDRKTVLNLHADTGYITPDAPFFERFYGGGRGSMRGFEYRGVSPRDGRALDPVGGDFNLDATAELSFPVYGDNFRGVVFTDVGTVEPDIRIHTIRQSVGAGIRVVVPFLSRAPLAFDLAFPVRKSDQDNEQIFSFGVGFER